MSDNKSNVWFNQGMELLSDVIAVIQGADSKSALYIICSHAKSGFSGRKHADKFVVEPRGLEGEAYVEFCLKFAAEHQIALFIPSRYSALIAANRKRFEDQGTRLLVAADAAMLESISHKTKLYQALGGGFVPIPEWKLVNTLAELEAGYADLRSRHSKVCFKPAHGVFAHGFRQIVETGSFFDRVMKSGPWTASSEIGMDEVRLCFGQQERFDDLVLMPFLGGVERSVDCLAHNGALIRSIIRLKSGEDIQVVEQNERIEQICMHICSKLHLSGICNIQFRDDAEGEAYLLEINSRMSGGLRKACQATEFSLPYWAICLALEMVKIADVPVPKTGVRLRRVTNMLVEKVSE